MKNLYFLTVILLASACSTTLPTMNRPHTCERLALPMPGPEDYAIDPTDATQLIVPAWDRRNQVAPGAVYRVDVSAQTVIEMARIGEPEGLYFGAHGADAKVIDGESRLYVISHDPKADNLKHSILVYKIVGNTLQFVQQLQDPLLRSPNDVAVSDQGYIYASNDILSETLGSLFGLRQEIVVFDGTVWKVAAEKLKFPNGLYADDKTLYVASSGAHNVSSYRIKQDATLAKLATYAELKTADNVIVENNVLYTTGHLDTMAFLRHRSDPAKPSPTVAVAINLLDSTMEYLYVDDGRTISAASSAAMVGDTLVLATVFEPYLGLCRPSTALTPATDAEMQ